MPKELKLPGIGPSPDTPNLTWEPTLSERELRKMEEHVNDFMEWGEFTKLAESIAKSYQLQGKSFQDLPLSVKYFLQQEFGKEVKKEFQLEEWGEEEKRPWQAQPFFLGWPRVEVRRWKNKLNKQIKEKFHFGAIDLPGPKRTVAGFSPPKKVRNEEKFETDPEAKRPWGTILWKKKYRVIEPTAFMAWVHGPIKKPKNPEKHPRTLTWRLGKKLESRLDKELDFEQDGEKWSIQYGTQKDISAAIRAYAGLKAFQAFTMNWYGLKDWKDAKEKAIRLYSNAVGEFYDKVDKLIQKAKKVKGDTPRETKAKREAIIRSFVPSELSATDWSLLNHGFGYAVSKIMHPDDQGEVWGSLPYEEQDKYPDKKFSSRDMDWGKKMTEGKARNIARLLFVLGRRLGRDTALWPGWIRQMAEFTFWVTRQYLDAARINYKETERWVAIDWAKPPKPLPGVGPA